MSKPRLVLECPEGFNYVGWQRCVCYMVCDQPNKVGTVKINVSGHVAGLWNANYLCVEPKAKETDMIQIGKGCFFVLSGESFTIQDAAQVLQQIVNLPIECVDGKGKPPTKPTGSPKGVVV